MKPLLLFGLFLVCALNTVYAQYIGSVEQEIKVRDQSYKITTREYEGGYYNVWIERTTDFLRNLEPGYQRDESMDIDFDAKKLKQLIKEHFLPFIKQSGVNLEDEDILTVNIFDLDGNIREMAIRFTSNLNIPMDVVDDFFTAVLSSGMKCTYRKDHPGLKNARFIYTNNIFDLKKLQE